MFDQLRSDDCDFVDVCDLDQPNPYLFGQDKQPFSLDLNQSESTYRVKYVGLLSDPNLK